MQILNQIFKSLTSGSLNQKRGFYDFSSSLSISNEGILGAILAVISTFGLAISGILWEFMGIQYGIIGFFISVIVLSSSLFFLYIRRIDTLSGHPNTRQALDIKQEEKHDPLANSKSGLIKEDLSLENNKSPIDFTSIFSFTFAPNNLLPSNSLNTPKQKPGKSLNRYRNMIKQLFN